MWWLQERFLEVDMCVVIDKEVGGYRFALCFRRLGWQWTQLAQVQGSLLFLGSFIIVLLEGSGFREVHASHGLDFQVLSNKEHCRLSIIKTCSLDIYSWNMVLFPCFSLNTLGTLLPWESLAKTLFSHMAYIAYLFQVFGPILSSVILKYFLTHHSQPHLCSSIFSKHLSSYLKINKHIN